MVELVDTQDLKSCGHCGRAGSTPAPGTVRFKPYSYMIDLRSDTVTRPCKAMLKAMVEAEVGDDVFGQDPTVNKLEQLVADRFGMESGLFCASGTMANQIAVMTHTRPGDEVICERSSHLYYYEQAGMARNSGVSANTIQGERGVFTACQVESLLRPEDVHFPTTSVVVAENTSNRGGGKIFPLGALTDISELTKERGLRFHLDGARLFNAIVADNTEPKTYGNLLDSISICLSKGLGCPVGTVLIGSKEFIDMARRNRKVLGGGMRQAGYLAAAGIYALNNNVDRLSKDHERTLRISKALHKCEIVKAVLNPETNILVFELNEEVNTEDVLSKLAEFGIQCFAVGEKSIRLVFHLDISEEHVDTVESAILQMTY